MIQKVRQLEWSFFVATHPLIKLSHLRTYMKIFQTIKELELGHEFLPRADNSKNEHWAEESSILDWITQETFLWKFCQNICNG